MSKTEMSNPNMPTAATDAGQPMAAPGYAQVPNTSESAVYAEVPHNCQTAVYAKVHKNRKQETKAVVPNNCESAVYAEVHKTKDTPNTEDHLDGTFHNMYDNSLYAM